MPESLVDAMSRMNALSLMVRHTNIDMVALIVNIDADAGAHVLKIHAVKDGVFQGPVAVVDCTIEDIARGAPKVAEAYSDAADTLEKILTNEQ